MLYDDDKTLLDWCDLIDSMPAGSTPVTEAARRLVADRARLRAALERIASTRCAWQLSQYIAREARAAEGDE